MAETRLAEVEAALGRTGCAGHRWLSAQDVVLARWVRLKCEFGCPSYGHQACCPPNLPPLAECRQLFGEYARIALLHFPLAVPRPEERHQATRAINARLLALEREAFLLGHPKAFALYTDPCHVCPECSPRREECKRLAEARPSPEGLCVDVFSTARRAGLPIQVLTDLGDTMNRYALLLLD
jgi:predicted metal-binding protein